MVINIIDNSSEMINVLLSFCNFHIIFVKRVGGIWTLVSLFA